MAGADRLLRGSRVVLPDGIRPAEIEIRNGLIHEIGPVTTRPAHDYGDHVIMPGLVDTHVHINEPGRTHWEGFATATRAAAAGGITTLIEMPLNAIPATTTTGALARKLAAAAGQCWVDIGFWGGVVPGNTAELAPLLEAGCHGFKCFLTPSGVDEFENVTEADLCLAMRELARHGAVLQVHAELPAALLPPDGDPRRHQTWLDSRPCQAEDAAIALLLRLSRETGCRLHIVHLASADSIAQLQQARDSGLPVSVETCPHYLTFSAEEIPDGATEFKCAPPLRPASNREALWEGLRSGLISMVVTDHSPSPPELKKRDEGNFLAAWGGIASLQLALPAVWTEASRRGFSLEDVTRWMCAAPARLAGLQHRKGAIAPGLDADFVIWDPAAEFTVDPTALHHRHKLTPYAGRTLRGVVQETWLRGEPIRLDTAPRGEILRRDRGLTALNALPAEEAQVALRRCCGSTRWAAAMTSARPFAGITALEESADAIWGSLSREDWLEAFAAHPKIGQQSASRWSRQEQAAAANAAESVLERLAALNVQYEEKFGYIYIVCATGKTAPEMLAILERRLQQDPAAEIREAAEQQRRITRLRLRKLLRSC
jgi:allantoinase